MKRYILVLLMVLAPVFTLSAQKHTKNVEKCSKADNVLGRYYIEDETGTSKAMFKKADDGTYYCQLYGGQPVYDKHGKMYLDVNNPDPALRNIPAHEAIIISGLKYNADKKIWEDGKIHNPQNRLMKANCTLEFVDDGKTVKIFGNLMGIGKSVYWTYLGK